MKTSAGIKVGEGVKAKRRAGLRSLFARVAKFVDKLVVKYYYKGERLRPEVRAEMEKEIADARQGKNVSPVFTNADDLIEWLDSRK